jgi:type II secretory pathway predicted ATPase ExeA
VEPVRHQGNMLAVVWAGHPKLCHDLPRPAMEDIGARATILTLEEIQGQQREDLAWVLDQCAGPEDDAILTPAALDLLAASLATPRQVEQDLTLALEAAYRAGQKPVTPDIISSV